MVKTFLLGGRNEKSGKKADLIEVVFLQQGDNVNMVPVKTGIQDDEYIHILSGLKEKDRVVTGPYSTVSRTLKQGSVVHEDTKKKGLDKEDKEEEQ